VRDTYDLGDKVIIITTDRQSAFDRHLASIPFKGQVRRMQQASCVSGCGCWHMLGACVCICDEAALPSDFPVKVFCCS